MKHELQTCKGHWWKGETSIHLVLIVEIESVGAGVFEAGAGAGGISAGSACCKNSCTLWSYRLWICIMSSWRSPYSLLQYCCNRYEFCSRLPTRIQSFSHQIIGELGHLYRYCIQHGGLKPLTLRWPYTFSISFWNGTTANWLYQCCGCDLFLATARTIYFVNALYGIIEFLFQ